jgi:hypothetical protein
MVGASVADAIAFLQTIPGDTELFTIAELKNKHNLMCVALNVTHPTKPHYKYFPPIPGEQPGQLVIGQYATNVENVSKKGGK